MKLRPAPVWVTLFQRGGTGPRSLRERICSAIRESIRTGALRFGDRLPASRVLSRDLTVSRITADSAYAQLAREGYVTRRVGDGTFVCIEAGAPTRTAPPPAAPAMMSRRGSALVRTGGCQDPRHPTAFSAGFPDLSEFPLDVWKRLSARRLRTTGSRALGYGDPAGEAVLREAIARYLNQSRAVRCSADQVMVLTSSQQAIQLAATILTDAGDPVWIENPGYLGARAALLGAGARLRPLPVDADGAQLPPPGSPRPRLIYVTPSHQYPLGVSLSLSRRLALLERARRERAWILEDDYDSEFQYDRRPLPAMQGLDEGGRVLYLGTFSKVLFPSLRLAYLVLPPSLVPAFVTARTTQDGHPARLAQLVTADFLDEGHFVTHLRRMRRLYRERRDLLLSEIDRHLAPWCAPVGIGAGLQLTVSVPRGREGLLTARAARAGVVTPGIRRLFLSRPTLDGWVLGFAALREEEIMAGVRRLRTIAALHEHFTLASESGP